MRSVPVVVRVHGDVCADQSVSESLNVVLAQLPIPVDEVVCVNDTLRGCVYHNNVEIVARFRTVSVVDISVWFRANDGRRIFCVVSYMLGFAKNQSAAQTTITT